MLLTFIAMAYFPNFWKIKTRIGCKFQNMLIVNSQQTRCRFCFHLLSFSSFSFAYLARPDP